MTKELIIKTTAKRVVVDITDLVNGCLTKEQEEAEVCHLFIKHTTASLTTADLDPGTDQDLLSFLEKITPNLNFKHPHDPSHAPDHLLSSIIGPSLAIPIKNHQLDLGTWQRVILIELDGPRERQLTLTTI